MFVGASKRILQCLGLSQRLQPFDNGLVTQPDRNLRIRCQQ